MNAENEPFLWKEWKWTWERNVLLKRTDAQPCTTLTPHSHHSHTTLTPHSHHSHTTPHEWHPTHTTPHSHHTHTTLAPRSYPLTPPSHHTHTQGWACILFKRTQRSCILFKRTLRSLHSFEKNAALFAFFYVLLKITLRSLRSLTFFCKARCALWRPGVNIHTSE